MNGLRVYIFLGGILLMHNFALNMKWAWHGASSEAAGAVSLVEDGAVHAVRFGKPEPKNRRCLEGKPRWAELTWFFHVIVIQSQRLSDQSPSKAHELFGMSQDHKESKTQSRGNFTQLSKKWDRLNCSTVVDSIRCTKKQRKTWPVQPKKFALAPVTQNRAVPWVIWVKNGEAPKTPRIIIFPYWQWSFMIRYWGIDHR